MLCDWKLPEFHSIKSNSPFWNAETDDPTKERLHIFKGELQEEGSFDSIVDGCEAVFHTASPVFFSASNPEVSVYCSFTSSFHVFVKCKASHFSNSSSFSLVVWCSLSDGKALGQIKKFIMKQGCPKQGKIVHSCTTCHELISWNLLDEQFFSVFNALGKSM